jgi:hypothetical protein
MGHIYNDIDGLLLIGLGAFRYEVSGWDLLRLSRILLMHGYLVLVGYIKVFKIKIKKMSDDKSNFLNAKIE